jgi:hypothetical protein
MTDWVLGVTPPNCERNVSERLSRFDFDHRIFYHRIRSAARGIIRERLIPLYSRYVFLPIVHAFKARDMREWTGVQQIVMFGEKVECVRPSFVENMEAKCEVIDKDGVGYHVIPETIAPYVARFQPQDPIRIIGDHTLEGHLAIYSHPVDVQRHVIHIDWFGRIVPVEIDEHHLEKYDVEKQRRSSKRKPKHLRKRRDYY